MAIFSIRYVCLGFLGLSLGACQWGNLPARQSDPPRAPIRALSPEGVTPSASVLRSQGDAVYQQALAQAASARSIAESAVSVDDWQLVRTRWQQAIETLRQIPADHPRYVSAIALQAQYQREHDQIPQPVPRTPASPTAPVSRQPSTPTVVTQSTPSVRVIRSGQIPGTTVSFSKAQSVTTAPVKRWIQNRPVIDVTFNDSVQFEMILNPTVRQTQITPAAADLMALTITQQMVDSSSNPPRLALQGVANTVSIDQLRLTNLLLTVGANELETGMLGQDFLDNFKIEADEKTVQIRIR